MSPRRRQRSAALAKLLAPQAAQIVRRARVLTAIERALRVGSCWLAAPAGYGKSMAAVDYLKKSKAGHVWYRVDDGDQDIASFFHYLSQTPVRRTEPLPVFATEYAEQPLIFARRFFRSYFESMRRGTILVLDDLHRVDTAQFRAVLRVLIEELPSTQRCLCISRRLPGREFSELQVQGVLKIIDQDILRFTAAEARAFVASRLPAGTSIDVDSARGWAAGLVLMADHASVGIGETRQAGAPGTGAFAMLARHFLDTLNEPHREALITFSLLPEIRADVAIALVGEATYHEARDTLEERQLLVSRTASQDSVLHLHDLLRAYLQERAVEQFGTEGLNELRAKAAGVLAGAGYVEAAIALALQACAWQLARHLIVTHAELLLAQGRRATLIEWCTSIPDIEGDDWLCYWLGVATTPDDATAEVWLARAYEHFAAAGELRGQALTAARAVLAKTDSWRTHEGLSLWTDRMLRLLGRNFDDLAAHEQLLVHTGLLRAVDFAPDYRSDSPAVESLYGWLLHRLRARGDSPTLRLLASAGLIEHAGSSGRQEVFEQAVDSVIDDLSASAASPWSLGLWLVAFGAVSGRYFTYSRRGFPYPSAEDALRAAVAIGEREALRGVEFGALYHLQLQIKARNDLTEFASLVARLAAIADSRYTTQVAVVADCQAALHTFKRDFANAYRACERFNSAIEAANEPPIERWPHFITEFQVLLADGKPDAAAQFLQELVHQFDGAVELRTRACIAVAEAFAIDRSSSRYVEVLRNAVELIRAANWPAILMNLPAHLAGLCADAIENGIEPDFCRSLVIRRRLEAPATRPAKWPWALTIRVLGEFKLERDGAALPLGAKPPSRSLDIVRMLALAKDHSCSLEQLHEALWPDAEGDQAKSACEQALHRLRKLLGESELIVQREGKIRLAMDKVWIDLDHWESQLRQALAPQGSAPDTSKLEQVYFAFPGPLLQAERSASWSLPAVERVRSKYIDLAGRLGAELEAQGNAARAKTVYLRAIDMYPTSERAYAALLRVRIFEGDAAGALEDYRRFERVLNSTVQTQPSRAIRNLIAPLLG